MITKERALQELDFLRDFDCEGAEVAERIRTHRIEAMGTIVALYDALDDIPSVWLHNALRIWSPDEPEPPETVHALGDPSAVKAMMEALQEREDLRACVRRMAARWQAGEMAGAWGWVRQRADGSWEPAEPMTDAERAVMEELNR